MHIELDLDSEIVESLELVSAETGVDDPEDAIKNSIVLYAMLLQLTGSETNMEILGRLPDGSVVKLELRPSNFVDEGGGVDGADE